MAKASRAARRRARKGLRSCGTCHACCVVLGVPEVDTEPTETCGHLGEGGCRIYHDRPMACRGFECGWRLGAFDRADRPDRCGLVIIRSRDFDIPDGGPPIPSLQVCEVAPESRAWPESEAMLDEMVKHFLVFIVCVDGQRRMRGRLDWVRRARDHALATLEEERASLTDDLPEENDNCADTTGVW